MSKMRVNKFYFAFPVKALLAEMVVVKGMCGHLLAPKGKGRGQVSEGGGGDKLWMEAWGCGCTGTRHDWELGGSPGRCEGGTGECVLPAALLAAMPE